MLAPQRLAQCAAACGAKLRGFEGKILKTLEISIG
jgi:hypothetical protein